MGYIYKIVNKNDGKIYVGATSRNLKKRMNEHRAEVKRNKNMILYNEIRIQGWENFYCEIIEETNDLENRERFWINEFDSLYPNGYNGRNGGKHFFGKENYFYNDHNKYAKGLKRSEESNLRIQKRKRGIKPNKKTTSKYVGVYHRKNKQFFESYIWYNKKTIYLGRYSTEEEAALAYNESALKYFGVDAKLNILGNKK